jgi:hypothetical protein
MRVNYRSNTTPYFKTLSDDQIEQIIDAAMEIL